MGAAMTKPLNVNSIVKPRNAILDTVLHAWMGLSMVSILPLFYFAGTFSYYLITSGILEKMPALQTGKVVLPAEQAQALFISVGLMVNYLVYKHFCQVVVHARLGVGTMLRSDVEKLKEESA